MSEQQNPILEALSRLDPNDDAHWTADGAPRVDVMQELTGLKDLSRADIIAVAPEFTRGSLLAPTQSVEESQEGGEKEEPGDELELLRERHDEVAAKIAEKKAQLNAISKEIVELTKEQDELIKQMEPGNPSHRQNQQNIMEFLASEARKRAERHQQRVALLKGIDPATLDPRSRIDQAFARKNTRGAQRPGARQD